MPTSDMCAEGLTSGSHAECGKHFVGRAIFPYLHSLNTLKISFICLFERMCTCVRIVNNLGKQVLCFLHVGPRAQTQAARLSGKAPFLPSQLIDSFKKCLF